MRLLRLRLEHFRSHEALDLDLRSVHAAAVVGRNGAGKSSLLLGVEWALFGPGSPDDYVRRGAVRGGVTLDFEIDGHRWRVARGRERGKRSWLHVFEDDQQVGAHTVAEAQELIYDIVGMDLEQFRASIYAPQGQAGVLASLTPGERKALLGGLLGLDVYEDWREQAAADARAQRQSVAVLDEALQRDVLAAAAAAEQAQGAEAIEAGLGALRERLTELDDELDAAGTRAAIAEQVRRRQDLAAQMADVKRQGDEAKASNERRTSLRAEVERLDKVATPADVRALEAEREAHQQATGEALAAARGHRDRRELAEQRLARARDTWDRLADDVRGLEESERRLAAARPPAPPEHDGEERCPTCGQAIADDQAHERVAAAHRQEVETWSTRLEDLGREVARYTQARNEALDEARAAESALEELGDAPSTERPPWEGAEDYARAREAVDGVARATAQLEALGEDVDREALRTRWEALKDERDGLPSEVPPGREAGSIRAEQADVRRDIAAREAELAAARAAGAEVERLEASIAAARERQAGHGERDEALSVLARAFSRDGIPAMILDNAIDGIQQSANDTLESLGSGLRLRLVTQAAKRSGKGTKETLEIMVDDGAFEAPIASFSGGERYRVHIALRMGLAGMLAAGSGIPADVLLIDEPTDLDKAGVGYLAEVLAHTGKQTLLVTHQDELVAAMPQRITVERSSDAAPSAVVVA